MRNAAKTSEARQTTPATLLGVRIDRLILSELLNRVAQSVRGRRNVTILYVNAHCMNVQYRDPSYNTILADADVVYCDGAGVVLAARLTGQSIPQRMTGADWIEDLCAVAVSRNLSLYFLGGTSNSVRAAATTLTTRFPGLRILGTADGFDTTPDSIARINQARPDILLVGMGTPRQEKWIARHRSQLDVPVVWAVGGLFDFVSGRVPRGPRWMTQHGLEWLCRLFIEPRRLWRRYLLGNPRFLWRVLTTHTAPAVMPAGQAPQKPVWPTTGRSI